MTKVSQAEHAPLGIAQCAWAEGGWPAYSSVLPLPWNTLSPAPEWSSTRHFSFSQSYSSKVHLFIIFVNLDHSTHGIKLLGLLVSTSPSPRAPQLPGSLAHSSKLGSLVLSQLLPTVDDPFCAWMLPAPQPIPACQRSLTHVAPCTIPCCVFHWDNVWIPLSVFSTFPRALKQSHMLCCVVIVTK